jgi:hypothetical protein
MLQLSCSDLSTNENLKRELKPTTTS